MSSAIVETHDLSVGFDTDRYFSEQMTAFTERIANTATNVIEFGGKPFGDYHASRVLPGYDPHVKADIIRCLINELGDRTELVFAVNALDILASPDGRRTAKRIRGDSGLTYDDEIFRIADQADREFDIQVNNVALSVVPQHPSEQNKDFIGDYRERLSMVFSSIHLLPQIEGYPSSIAPEDTVAALTQAPPIAEGNNLVVLSPGGGSGKFSVAVSEIAHALKAGCPPNFIKFETFPVFSLSPAHPLNRAFLAATADLSNELITLENGLTNYDKDVQNLGLLHQLIHQFPDLDTSGIQFEQPTDMGVNVIDVGITDEQVVSQACTAEIDRRIRRYRREYLAGNETKVTLDRTIRCTE